MLTAFLIIFKNLPNKGSVVLSKQSETKILEDNQMLKQISMALAILFAGITVTIFPAISEVTQPDATAKEQQVEDENQLGVEEDKCHFEGRRRDRSDAGYRADDQRKRPGRGRRMSQDRRFRDRRSSNMVKGKSGRMLPPELAKRLTAEQRREVQQSIKELRKQHHSQMKSKIAGLLKGYGIELPEPKEKKPEVDK